MTSIPQQAPPSGSGAEAAGPLQRWREQCREHRWMKCAPRAPLAIRHRSGFAAANHGQCRQPGLAADDVEPGGPVVAVLLRQGGSLLSAGVFYKKVSDYIGITTDNTTVNGRAAA